MKYHQHGLSWRVWGGGLCNYGIHILPIFLKSNAIFSWLKINRITKQKLKYHSKILKINPKFTE